MSEVADHPPAARPDFRDPAFYAGDPHTTYRWLRRHDPVHRDERSDMWVLTRHEDVQAAARDPQRFCSGKGVLLGDRDRPIMASQSILYLDPPQHGHYRKVVAGQFHGRRIATLETRIREVTRDLLEDVDVGEPFDAVAALAVPLPLVMIADLVGIPRDRLDDLARWSDSAIAAAAEPNEENVAGAIDAVQYLKTIVDARREDPGDDLISDLLVAEVEGHNLDENEILGFCITLLVAGNETTRHLLGGSLHVLAEHTDQWERLRDDPELVPTAVEELLRWVSPFTGFARTATEDVEWHDTRIAAGDYVLLLYESANRDEEVFGDSADSIDVGRDPNPHVTFGFGPHYCLGASLARMEARVVLQELLERYTEITPAGGPVRTESAFVNGLEELPLVLR